MGWYIFTSVLCWQVAAINDNKGYGWHQVIQTAM